MKFIVSMFFLTLAAMAQEVQSFQPTIFNIGLPGDVLDVNVGRGGSEYRVRIVTAVRGQIQFRIDYQITRTSDNANISPSDATFLAWNDLQEKPYYLQVDVEIKTQGSHGVSAISQNFPAATPEVMQFQYTPTSIGYVGADVVELEFYQRNGFEHGPVLFTKNFELKLINAPPAISLSVSPPKVVPGASVALLPTINDANGHVVFVSYDYGDGSQGTAATHSYASPGVYTVTALANDGFDMVTSTARVEVLEFDHLPVARFTSSDIVAFVGIPFVVDGITSTDEQNSIVSFSWDFGDGTPLGSVPALSHVYKLAGPVVVTLIVTDAEGLSATLSRQVEVLEQAAAGTFSTEISVASTFFPLKQNRDILTVFARVNIGDTELLEGSALALEYGGKRFTATLGKRGKAPGWTVKQNLRRQTPGTVEITFKARNTAIAAELDGLGAIDDGTIDVPFRLELGPKTIQVDVQTDFEIGGARGKGQGEL